MDAAENESLATIFVRDLLWVANSPSLLAVSGGVAPTGAHDELFSVASDQPFLNQSEINADHLQDFLTKNPHVSVGRYFESLVFYWIKYIRGLEVLVCNEQITRAGRTIGEIDLVFRNEQDRLIHWETAVKFFLHFPQPHSFPSDYIGPNSRDTLDSKMNHLFGHQLKQSLDGPINADCREAFVRGCIFYHPSNPFPDRTHSRLHAAHLRGLWIHSSEVDELPQAGDWNYRLMRKPHWLALSPNQVQAIPSREIDHWVEQQFGHSDRPVMLCPDRSTGNLDRAADRIMIVSDQWPSYSKK
ncbi:MAG: DUF1853 family protein [Pirellulales bacterium]|jgi:hypothetical protein